LRADSHSGEVKKVKKKAIGVRGNFNTNEKMMISPMNLDLSEEERRGDLSHDSDIYR